MSPFTFFIAVWAAIFFSFTFDVLDSQRLAAKFVEEKRAKDVALGIRSFVGVLMFIAFLWFFSSFNQIAISTIAMIEIQLAVLGVFLTTFWRVKEIRKSRSGELENGASQ